MNKLGYLFLGLSGLALVSCSETDVVGSHTEVDGNFHVTVSLPKDITTRSFGDGLTSTVLNVAAYDVNNNNLLAATAKADFEGKTTTTVGLNLVNGKSYLLAFFAQSEASQGTTPVYDFNAEEKTMTVNYKNMTSEGNLADAYDCFFKTYPTGTVGNNNTSANVELTRPVAQLNWGTTEITGASQDLTGVTTTLTANGMVPNTLNLLTGEVSGSTELQLSDFAVPSGETYPVEGYNYLAMNYLLTGSTSTTYDLSLTISMPSSDGRTYDNDVVVANAPVQANYRTNIYGNLLSVNATFTVTKDAEWGGSSFNMPIVDTFKGLLDAAANGEDVVFTTDLEGATELPGWSGGRTGIIQNGGTIDGNGFTLTVTDENNLRNSSAILTTGGTIKNLTIQGPSAIQANNVVENLYIDNCIFEPADNGYGLNVNAYSATTSGEPVNIIVSNSTLTAWISAGGNANFGYLSFDTCEFNYVNTNCTFDVRGQFKFDNCKIDENWVWRISYTPTGDSNKVILNNCFVGDILITGDNFMDLFTSVTLPSGKNLNDIFEFMSTTD